MKIAVAVASIRRPEEIGQLLSRLERQTVRPAQIILSLELRADAPADLPPGLDIILGPPSATGRSTPFVRIATSSCSLTMIIFPATMHWPGFPKYSRPMPRSPARPDG